MAWRLARSLDTLRTQVNSAYPTRSKVSDGSIGDTAHSSRVSDHNPDANGVVHAIDVTQDDPNKTPYLLADDVAEWLAESLRRGRDPRIKYVIWRGRMFSSYSTRTRKAWEWGPYNGPNGHFHHVHVSVNSAGADLATPFALIGAPVTSPVDPNLGRPYIDFNRGTTDATVWRKGGQKWQVAELEMLFGHSPTGIYTDPLAAEVVALKRKMGWHAENNDAIDRTPAVDLRFITAVRNLVKK